MSAQVTFDAFVMFAGGEEVPEQTGLTRAECVAQLAETCEHYAVDLILHIHTDEFPTGWECEDVTDEIVNEVANKIADDDYDPEDWPTYVDRSKLQDTLEERARVHPYSAMGAKVDMQVDEMRGA